MRFCTYIGGPDENAGNFVHWQWRKNGVPIEDAPDWWRLVLREVTESDEGQYSVKATNACGFTISGSATLNVAPPTGVPEIFGQPAPTFPYQGQKTILKVYADCADSYQWAKNNVPIPGATSYELLIPSVTCSDAASYKVKVGNVNGFVISAPTTITVMDCP